MDGLFNWLTQSPDVAQIAVLALVGLAGLVLALAVSKIGGNLSVGVANTLTSVGKGIENVTDGIKQLAGPFNFWNKAGDALIKEAENREPVFDLKVRDANGNSLELMGHGYDVALTIAENMGEIPHPPSVVPAVPQLSSPSKKRGLLR